MVHTSKTGLLSSVQQRNIGKKSQEEKVLEFKNIAVPAPFVLRPFAGIYNPFPYGCSILCNHPADCEAKDVVKRAKESWATEGKSGQSDSKAAEDPDDLVPEELFRRYTETDSRPITPTPTLASVMTRVPRGRRCVTPDPVPVMPAQERTLLVLDLRRSHSQETLSCHQTGLPTTILQPPTRSPTPSSGTGMTTTRKATKPRNRLSPDHLTRPEDTVSKPPMMSLPPPSASSDEDGLPRRRGRMRRKGKKSGRGLSAGIEKEVKGLPDPGETQVSAFGIDSRLGSARASFAMQGGDGTLTPLDMSGMHTPETSYLDLHILKQLRRELDQEVIENEFDLKRRVALQEAMRTFPVEHKTQHSDEMTRLHRELRLPPENTELWLSLPRTFYRQSARFELPLDRRELNVMTPIQYIQRHVSISSNRRLLYNRVFNRHRRQPEPEAEPEPEPTERVISGQKMSVALGEMMGRAFTDEEATHFSHLVGWNDNDWLDFRTWCGICALCERIMGPQFCAQLPTREADPPNGVEQADFDSLARRLDTLNPDPRLKTILLAIKTL